jgi:acetyl-CoA hydrolase
VADHSPARLDIASLIRPGDLILVEQGVAEPVGLVAAVREQADDLPECRVFVGFSLSGLFDVDLARRIQIVSYGAMGSLAAVEKAGLLDVVPCNYSDLPDLVREGPLRPDVVLIQVTPPDSDGFCSMGVGMDAAMEAVSAARTVIAEVNDQLPRVRGEALIPWSRIDASVDVSRPLISVPTGDPTGVDEGIAQGVTELVPDGAVLQLGFGSTVTAIGRLLRERRNLRIHSALVGDWLLDLADAGALASVDDSDRPVVRTGAVMGSQALYDFVSSDPRVEFSRIEDIQSPGSLASVKGLIAINGAVQVDLRGQINVEVVGERRISALGGHTDFLRGGQRSAGGTSVVVLPSTAGRRRVSRIVPTLDQAWVSTQQSMVDHVVTEHGRATLRGTTLSQRRSALAAIADPAARTDLTAGHAPATPTTKESD